jgi:DNA-binding GntR family transcriptional regulator
MRQGKIMRANAEAPRKGTGAPKPARPAVPKGEGRGRVYETLRERILSLDLEPGEPLEEAALGKVLNVSRTPLREALVRLAAEGLVEVLPNKGARVAPIELRQLQEHLEAFELMQRTATVLAAQRRTEEDIARLKGLCSEFEEKFAASNVMGIMKANLSFHQAVGAASGNRYIDRMYDWMLTDGLRIARLAMAYECYGSADAYEAHMANIVKEHRELVSAIEQRDVETASRLSDSHSDLARQRVSDYLTRNLTRGLGVPGFPATGGRHV